jgi:outer membrane protein assembly factor BamB
VILGKYLYQPCAGRNALQCLDLESGEELWSERTSHAFWGSMVLAEGLIYVTDQSGKTLVLQPNETKLELKYENTFEENSNATPALFRAVTDSDP